MIGYLTVGTNDIKRAAEFYDALLGAMGAGRFLEDERFIAWSVAPEATGFCITQPFDGNPATVGNGDMTAFIVDSNEKVDEMYKKAIELGATDEGEPGYRMDGFYAGYFRDLDGNKLNFFHMPAPTG
ncbi:MAG: VOC family protein [Xanthomonadales bacterium]|nr:VOC family protein [Xanthomonadales bacterium]